MPALRRTEDLDAADRGYYVVADGASTSWPYTERCVLAGPFSAAPIVSEHASPREPERVVRFWDGAVWRKV
jgi:hypothetical protein